MIQISLRNAQRGLAESVSPLSGSFCNGPFSQAAPVILPLVARFCPWSA